MPQTATECLFCGTSDVVVQVGIAIGMGGADYAFCLTCLKGRSAFEFWRDFFDRETVGGTNEFAEPSVSEPRTP